MLIVETRFRLSSEVADFCRRNVVLITEFQVFSTLLDSSDQGHVHCAGVRTARALCDRTQHQKMSAPAQFS